MALNSKLRSTMHPKPVKGEINELASKTQPDMTLSIRQLLDNHTRGTFSLSERTPVYNDDVNVPDFRKMDLVEIQEYRLNLAKEMQDKQAYGNALAREQLRREEENKLNLQKSIQDEIKNSLGSPKSSGD